MIFCCLNNDAARGCFATQLKVFFKVNPAYRNAEHSATLRVTSVDPLLCFSFLTFPFSLLQIATSSWPMLRCPRVSPSSTAPMASASLRASLGPRWCRRAAPASSCMDRRQAKASSSASVTPWKSARSSRMRSCFTKRQVSSSTCTGRSHFWASYITIGPTDSLTLSPTRGCGVG